MAYNNSHFPRLGQLKDALTVSRGEVTQLAALVVGTIEDMILQADITIPASAWAANTDSATKNAGYDYKADIAVAAEAGVCPTAHVSDGSIRFFAKTVPSAALAGKLDAVQLDDSE